MQIRHNTLTSESGSSPPIGATQWDEAHEVLNFNPNASHLGGVVSGAYYSTAGSAASGISRTMAANDLALMPYLPPVTFTADRIGIFIGNPFVAGNLKLLAYAADTNGFPGARLFESADIASTATNTGHYATCSLSFVAGRLYWLGVRVSAAMNLWSNSNAYAPTIGLSGGTGNLNTSAFKHIQRTLTFATSAPDPFGAVTTSDMSTGNPIFVGVRTS